MSVLLKDLLEEISCAISNANVVLEENALNFYMAQGYKKEKTEQGNLYSPIMFHLALQEGKEVREIPVSALIHNTTMRLEQVDIKLKFKMFEENGAMQVSCMPEHSEEETLDEITLQYKNTVPPEGIARITDNYVLQL